MFRTAIRMLVFVFVVVLVTRPVTAAPPFAGTVFLEPDIITETDPTAFVNLLATGRGMRRMFDRRVNGWIDANAYLFVARYDDGLQIEIQVNPEFGTAAAAKTQADFYAPVFGRLPHVLRKDVQTSWIHKGDHPFGGGNKNLLIHTGRIGQNYIRDGILEEALVHEAAHTSLDSGHATSTGWVAAQASDPEFISTYARDNPQSEDIAETFLTYLAQKYRSHRISTANLRTFRQTVPDRNAYFDSSNSNLYPFEVNAPGNRYYRLSSLFRGNNMHLDVFNGGEFNNMTHLVAAGNFSGQFWKFTPRADGWSQITNQFRGANLCLDIHNGGRFNNAPHLTTCENFTGQLWKLIAAGRDRYRLVTRFRGDDMCLDIHNGGPFNNMPHLVKCADYSGQYWALTPAG